ncbi:MAG: methyltransferase domain-containing protein [Geminicoccaceae bacterium]
MNHLDHLTSLIDLQDLAVVDVGAGDGKFARAFARRGAVVTGIEIDDEKVEIARQAAHENVRILLGRGEDLPLDDRTTDLVCFMFSFHHVPQPLQNAALDEVWRVLKPGGRLHVLEPLPGGPMSEVMAPLDDETEVRTRSQALLDDLPAHGCFSLRSRQEYAMAYRTADFETYLKGVIAVDPRRARLLPSVRGVMEEAFQRLGQPTDDGVLLEQPCVAYHLEKIG